MKHLKLFSSSGCSADAQHPVSRLSRFDSVSIVSRQSVLGLLLLFLTAFSGSVWGAEVTVAKNLSDVATANEWSTSAGTDVTTYTSWNVDANITVSVNESGNNGSYWSNGWRCYESSSAAITIAAPNGYTIKSVTITYASTKNNGCITGVTSGTAKTVNAQSVTYNVSHSSGSNKGQVGITAVSVTYESPASTNPDVSLTPSSLENLAATDVEDQEITVACTNFANAITSVTAALYSNSTCTEEYTVDPWATNIAVNDAKTKVSFSVADNDGAARQAWLKVTATDGTSTESAILPISQKAAPLTTMDAIFAAATANGNTAKEATITFNNWVVSAVNGSNVYVTDGTKGFVIYKSSHGFAVNDKLNGTVVGSLKLYNGFAEEVSITASAEGLTVTKDGTITPVELDAAGIDALSGVNTGSVINLRGKCTKSDDKYYVAGVQLYNSLYSYSVTANHSYDVTGVYTQFNSTKEVLPRSAADIEEIPTPLVTVKNNAEVPETITSMAFGNVGQRWQQSFVFGFSYENLEAGDLTMTIGGTNKDAFAFYGGGLTETVNIASAGNGSVSSLSFHQATDVAGEYSATLTISGCGLLEDVVLPITMTVKAPEFEVSASAVHFGNVKQHMKATKTFTLTGKYLSGDYSVKISAYGAVFDVLSSGESYYIWPNENKEINETVTVICNAENNVDPNTYESHLVLQSTANVEEFADITDLINFDATVVATYKVGFKANDPDRGTLTINGVESDEYGKVDVYVVDGNEDITMVATPELGWKFNNWKVANADVENVLIDDAESAETYAYVSAATTSDIEAVFIKDCEPLARPSDAGYVTKTYNSANLKWQWVWEDENKAATYHLHAFETENPSAEINKDLTFTAAELESSTLYYTLEGLKGNTAYTVEVWGTSVADGFCPTGQVAEITFTTNDYPAATLTLSENGVERTWGTDLKVASEVTLPAAPATNIVDKVFIGWITESSYSHATDAPANIKKAGDSYTVAAVADKLYAVYATATPGAITTIFSQNFNSCEGTGGNDGKWSGSIATTDLPELTGWTFANGKAADQCVKLGTGSAKGSAETPAITMSSNGTLTFRAGAWNSGEESTTLNISATNATLNKSSVTLTKGEFNSFSATITNVTGNVKIKFEAAIASKNRFFLDDVVIESQGPTTYSNYVTSGPKLLALPTFDPEESETVYTEALEVEISAAEGTIHYTTDGTDPTSESPTYSSAITLNKYGVNTVKAIAIDGDNRSNIATANYKLDLPFASFEDLVDAKLYNGDDGTNVIVSFENVEITDLEDSEVYLNVKGSDNANISIFGGSANHPAGWVVGGKLSGTSIAGTWRANTVVNDYLYISSWTGITYTKPASGLAWSAASATVKKGAKAAMNVYPTLTKPEDLTATITYSSSDESKATIDANGVITLVAAGETTITAQFENDAKYADAEVSYTLTIAPQASVTVTPALLNYGKVKTGTASVNIDILDFKISSENLTEGRAVSIAAPAGFSVTATQLWPPLSANYYITVNIDDATLNTAGVYDGNVVISSDDLEENVIVAVKLTVEDAYAIEEVSEGGWIEWNGSASTPESAFAGTEYTLEAKHDMSHEGGSIKVYKASDDSEVPEEVFDGTTLTMPAYAIKVVATFLLPAANISWESTEPLVLKQSQASNYSNWRILNNAGYSVTVTSSNTDVIAAMQPYSGSTNTTRWFPNGAVNVGTTTITATFAGNDNYRETSVSYEVTIENDVPTAIDEVNGETKAVKFIENNQIFIRRGDKTFNAQGQLVK